jgi:hypothetical protein
MTPLYDYLAEDKDNELCIEQYGELTVNQSVEAPLKRLEDAWAERKKELLAQPEDKRDKNAYFWTLMNTFKYELTCVGIYEVFQISVEIVRMQIAKQFYLYLD